MIRTLFFCSFVWKTLRRNFGRTLFVALSVTLAAAVALVVMSVLQGMSDNLRSAVVLNNTGDYQIQDPDYSREGVPQSPLIFSGPMKDKIKAAHVTQFSPELVMEGYLSTPEGDAALKVVGIVPELHSQFIPLAQSVKEGSFFKGKENSPVVIGAELAKEFGLKVGNDLVLNFQDKEGGLRSELLTVSGIYSYSSRSFQMQEIYIRQNDWQKLFFGEEKGEFLFNRLPMMASTTQFDAVRSSLHGSEVRFKSWRDENPEMSVAVDFNNLMIRFCVIIIFLTAFITIIGPVQILWEEREAELKMLTILGVSKSEFYVLAFIELIMVFLLSSAFAFIFMSLFFLTTNSGLDLNFLNRGIKLERAGIIIDWLIHPALGSANILMTGILVMSVLLVSYLTGVKSVLARIMKAIA